MLQALSEGGSTMTDAVALIEQCMCAFVKAALEANQCHAPQGSSQEPLLEGFTPCRRAAR